VIDFEGILALLPHLHPKTDNREKLVSILRRYFENDAKLLREMDPDAAASGDAASADSADSTTAAPPVADPAAEEPVPASVESAPEAVDDGPIIEEEIEPEASEERLPFMEEELRAAGEASFTSNDDGSPMYSVRQDALLQNDEEPLRLKRKREMYEEELNHAERLLQIKIKSNEEDERALQLQTKLKDEDAKKNLRNISRIDKAKQQLVKTEEKRLQNASKYEKLMIKNSREMHTERLRQTKETREKEREYDSLSNKDALEHTKAMQEYLYFPPTNNSDQKVSDIFVTIDEVFESNNQRFFPNINTRKLESSIKAQALFLAKAMYLGSDNERPKLGFGGRAHFPFNKSGILLSALCDTYAKMFSQNN